VRHVGHLPESLHNARLTECKMCGQNNEKCIIKKFNNITHIVIH